MYLLSDDVDRRFPFLISDCHSTDSFFTLKAHTTQKRNSVAVPSMGDFGEANTKV